MQVRVALVHKDSTSRPLKERTSFFCIQQTANFVLAPVYVVLAIISFQSQGSFDALSPNQDSFNTLPVEGNTHFWKRIQPRSQQCPKMNQNKDRADIRSLQSDSGVDSEGQQSSAGSFTAQSPPASYRELPGYDIHIFKTPPNNSYRCGICNGIARWPVQTDCACGLFCHGCLHRYIGDSTGDLECPRCAETFPVREIQRDKVAHKKLLRLEIVCPHGCESEMLLKDLDRHEEDCQFVPIECINRPQGCQNLIRRNLLAEHLEIQCDYRKVLCKHCNQPFQANKLQEHQENCPFSDPVINVLMGDNGSEEGESSEGAAKVSGVSQQVVRTMALNLDAKITEVKRLVMEVGNERQILKSIIDGNGLSIEKNKHGLEDLDQSIKQLQKMVLSKLLKLPALERTVEGKLPRTEFEGHLKSVKEDLEDQKKRLILLEDEVNTGVTASSSGLGGSGVSNRLKEQITENSKKIRQVEDQVSMHSMRLAEHELRFQFQETASYDGTLIWKIKEFARRKRDADNGKTLSLYSQPFYTSRFGYKMCARIYLNGDGIGKGTHVSLFFVVMKGDYDALLTWPFSQKVTLMLLDQETGRRHLSDSFRPDPTSTSFQRPSTNMNIASGCPLFVSQSVLKDPAYVKEDTIFIKVVVDTTDLYGP